MDFLEELGCKRKQTEGEETDEEDFKRVKERTDELRSLFEKSREGMEYLRAKMLEMKADGNDKANRIPLKIALQEENAPIRPIDPARRQSEKVLFEDVKALAKSLSAEGDLEMNYKVIGEFVQLVQKVWAGRRSDNPDGTLSLRSRLLSHAYELFQSYISALTKPLQEFTIPEDILDSFTKSVLFCLERDYAKAYETHSQIDNVNARLLRNIPMSEVFAGVEDIRCYASLEDFGQRKYLMGFKMLIDMSKKFFPPNPVPSKLLECQDPSQTKDDQEDK